MNVMEDAIISDEQVIKIAQMSKLDVSGEENKLSKILSETLNYIKILNELDTSTTRETFQVTGLTNVFQDNKQKAGLSQKEVLDNAKETKDGLIVTSGVFDRD